MALEDPEYMTVAEVAALLRVSKMTVYRLISDGELPARKIGRRTIRIPANSVRRLLPCGGGAAG